MSRKPHQQPGKMRQRLNTIWGSGDRDEGSFKHILHGLKALFAGKAWSEGDDYRMATSRKESYGKPFGSQARKKWGKIQTIRDELGVEKFKSLIWETPDWGESIGIYTKKKR